MKNTQNQMTWIRYGFKKIGMWMERQRTLKQLNALNNHMLRDIGLDRTQIEATIDRIGREHEARWREQRRLDSKVKDAIEAGKHGDAEVKGVGADTPASADLSRQISDYSRIVTRSVLPN